MLHFKPSNTTPVFRFDPTDEVIIQGKSYIPYRPAENGYLFKPADGIGFVVEHSHETIAAWVARGDLLHMPGKFSPEAVISPQRAGTDGLSLVDGDAGEMLSIRRAFVLAFLDLERDGAVQRTDDDLPPLGPSFITRVCGFEIGAMAGSW